MESAQQRAKEGKGLFSQTDGNLQDLLMAGWKNAKGFDTMASTGVVHKRDEIYASVKAVDESIATAGEDHHLNVAEIATTVECVLTPEGREFMIVQPGQFYICLLYTSPSPRD